MGFEIPKGITQIPYFEQLIFTLIAVIAAVIVAAIFRRAMRFVVMGIRNRQALSDHFKAKTRTVTSLMNSVVNVIVFAVAGLIILSRWEIDITPIIASAGVFGLALSFGSQTLVKDIIAGVFIFLEDQFNVGDVVKIGAFEGKVKRVTLRLTVLQDADGNYVYMPNSTITSVVRIKVAPEGVKPATKAKQEEKKK